jgi:hypothetical protein
MKAVSDHSLHSRLEGICFLVCFVVKRWRSTVKLNRTNYVVCIIMGLVYYLMMMIEMYKKKKTSVIYYVDRKD